MRKSASLTAALTAAGVLLFLAPAAPAQSSGSTGGSNDSAAQSGQSGSGSASTTLSATDRKFVTEAAEGGLAEVTLGRLAAEKGSSEQVKQFGQKMVDDHGKANEELKDLATRKGITLPDQPSAKDKATEERLSKLSGSEFDRAYMRDMEKDHNKDVAEFKKASEKAKDPDIRQWAAKTLPTLEEHNHLAHKTMAALGGESRGKATGMSADEPSPGTSNPKPMGEERPGTGGQQQPRVPR